MEIVVKGDKMDEKKAELKICVRKGTSQIGGCVTEIQSNRAKILIDFGEDLDEEKKTKETPQIEGLTCGKPDYDAVFITHSHQDHIGLIDQILPEIPVYVEEKSYKIYELTCAFTGKSCRKNVCLVKEQKNREYEPILVKDMQVQYYKVDHSAYNSAMLLITCGKKRILHTGDFRSHGYKGKDFEPTLRKIRRHGEIDCLITEGTVLGRGDEKYQTEDELRHEATRLFQKYNQVFVLQSSTNIDRITSFCKASFATKKKFIEDVFTANITMELGGRIPNPAFDGNKVSVWRPFKYNDKPREFKEKYVEPLEKYKRTENVYGDYCMLVKTSMYEDIKMLVEKGKAQNACLVYSMWHGYLDKPETKQFVEQVKALGIDFAEIHTSGHADLETMKKVEKILKPKKVIVIHTQEPEKARAVFPKAITVKDGERIVIQEGMEVKEFIQRYLNKKGYFYRLRGKPGKEQMLVYYHGVKILELNGGKTLVPSIQFYLPNSKNNAPENVPEQAMQDYINMIGDNAPFEIYHKGEIYSDYKEFYCYCKTLNSKAKESVRFIGKDISNITKKELEKIEEILERRIRVYSNEEQNEKDFGPTTKDANGKEEKIYQLDLMNILNNSKEKAKILPSPVFKDTTVPLEMEYGIQTSERKKRINISIPEGRIDNVCIDGDTVNLVEIKIGTKVIDGANGIHKHLLDIAYCCKKHSIIQLQDFKQLIQERNAILESYQLENPINPNVEKLEYNIICGYKDQREKEAVEKLLEEIYSQNIREVIKR